MVQAKDVIDALLKIMPELTQDDAVKLYENSSVPSLLTDKLVREHGDDEELAKTVLVENKLYENCR
ncbi:hypothetical protein MmarC5_0635 [Methanococcus maripaludis C5]|uniref:Uncharacterized protein n=1 Tax=Methanococcus maripaludis (strain C5 / ATCC BAA-1333) TaxID=402880 RepID=A4FXL3_METM5|nr:hypothetical protein [Methanococcus maripaludis]ABO34947.1 hypothetical protein MmarC5_0635 [Methanococcus maripaludis C5]